MFNKIIVDCVVKPVISTAVTMGTMLAVGVIAVKIDEVKTSKHKKKEQIIDVKVVE